MHWSDNHCKNNVSMLDLYELVVKLGWLWGDDEFVNDDQFGEGFLDDQFDEGFVDAQFGEGFTDDDLNRYGESVNVDELVDIDVQVEEED
ncbi:hypothetical protein ACE6H2_020307 [Prunus campanulata]